jgi:glycosyltransferase involved in cell wall biosynthesis
VRLGFLLSDEYYNFRYTQFVLELAEELSTLNHSVVVFSNSLESSKHTILPISDIPKTTLDHIIFYSVYQIDLCLCSPARNKLLYFMNPVESYKNPKVFTKGNFKLVGISSVCSRMLEAAYKHKSVPVVPGAIGKNCAGYTPEIVKDIGILQLAEYDALQGGSVADSAVRFARGIVDNLSVITTNYEDIHNCYNRSVLYITASSLIGFDFCALEALHCGCCVVSTHTSDFLSKKNSVISNNTAYHLSRNIVEILKNTDLRTQLRKTGLTINKDSQFSIKTVAQNFLKII